MANQPESSEVQIRKWVLNAQNGELDAFNALVLFYQEAVYNHACLLLGDPEQAQDAVQDSFIKAYQGIARFRNGSFRAWLFRIVTNTCYDMIRQARRHPTQRLYPEDEDGDKVESPDWVIDPAPSIQARSEQNEDSLRLRQALNMLPAAYRSVLTLVEIYDLDYAEVAVALGIPLGTVKSRLARARLRIGEILFGGNSSDLALSIERVRLAA